MMTEKELTTEKLTPEETIKALECCGKFGSFVCDEKCPVFKSKCETLSDCRLKLHKLSLDLINRQQAEIERLKHEREVLIEDIHHSADQINEQLEEIERLTINMNAFGLGMKREKERADTTRAEAIKEFADEIDYEILHKEFWNDHPHTSQVWLNGYEQCMRDMRVMLKDKLKEMVGK
jgi:hypothetical protein